MSKIVFSDEDKNKLKAEKTKLIFVAGRRQFVSL
jgi:hypothetical protein